MNTPKAVFPIRHSGGLLRAGPVAEKLAEKLAEKSAVPLAGALAALLILMLSLLPIMLTAGCGKSEEKTSPAKTPPTWEWTLQNGTAAEDTAYDIAAGPDGGIYLTGRTRGSLDGNTSAGSSDIFITRYDTDGNRLWTVQPGTPYVDLGLAIAVDSTGNSYVTGTTDGGLDGYPPKYERELFITCYDSNGTRQWTVQTGTTLADDIGYGAAVGPGGDVWVTGFTGGNLDNNTNGGYGDLFLTRYDAAGNRLWTVLQGAGAREWGTGVAVDSAGNAYVTGIDDGGFGGNMNADWYDILVSKFDPGGNLLWTVRQGTQYWDEGTGIAVDPDGNAYVTGSTSGGLENNNNRGGTDFFISKFNPDGTLLWTVQHGTRNADMGTGIALNSAGDIFVTGYTYPWDASVPRAVFTARFSPGGALHWMDIRSADMDSEATAVTVDAADNAYVTGFTEGGLDGNTNQGLTDFFLMKYLP